MRVLLLSTAAGLAIALAAGPASAQSSDTVVITANDSNNDVNINLSFTFNLPPDSVDDPSDFSSLTALSLSFAPYGSSTFPAASFNLASLSTITSEISGGTPAISGPFETFTYNTGFPGTFDIEADGTTNGGASYFGFSMQDQDGANYQYGVGGTAYGGAMTLTSLNDPAASAPEPASIALLGAALAGVAVTRRRKRRTG